MNSPTYFYRHDSVITERPFGTIDVDPRGRLWRSSTADRVMAHNLHTAALDRRTVPEMGGQKAFSVFCWHDLLVMTLGEAPFYLLDDPATGRARRVATPIENAVVWYGCKLPGDRLMLCHRGGPGFRGGQAWILDAPDAPPRVVPFPYRGDFDTASVEEDGLAYILIGDPARVVRFDPATPGKEKFIDEKPLPWPEVGASGRLSHGGILYATSSAGGAMLPMDLRTQRWLDPIPHPRFGQTFGFIGPGFKHRGKLLYCTSNYAHRSRLDLDTGQIILPPPEVPMTVDGKPERFLERMIVFDPGTQKWEDDLIAPPQPDGVAVLVYSWYDANDFAITGCLMLSENPEACGDDPGPWVVLQSREAKARGESI